MGAWWPELHFLWPNWVWMIALPIITSPFVYLLGRLFQRARDAAELHGKSTPWRANPIRWVSLAILLLSCIPFVGAWRDLAAGETLQITVGIIALKFDGISLLLSAAVLALGVLVSIFSGPYIGHESGQEKYHALLNAMLGAMLGLGCAADLFNLWVWFETAAVASYMLVAYHSDKPASLEAGMKYLVQNSVGSMLVLIGIGLVFSQTGTLNLAQLRTVIAQGAASRPLLLAAGALFVVGFGVKIAMVPMHTWLPDAHSQAPSGISALLSGVVIETGLVALLRALSAVADITSAWGAILLAFGAVNMVVGNLLALRQTQVKRLLAFSSLTHVGYMLLGLGFAVSFGQGAGAQGGVFHLLTHAAMKGLAFLAAGSLLFALRLSRGDSGPAGDGGPRRRGPQVSSHRPGAHRGPAGTRRPAAAGRLHVQVADLRFGCAGRQPCRHRPGDLRHPQQPALPRLLRTAGQRDVSQLTVPRGDRRRARPRRHDGAAGAPGHRRRGVRRVAGPRQRPDGSRRQGRAGDLHPAGRDVR